MERPKSHETFNSKAIADLEIQSIKYEFQDDQKAKFDCDVKITQLLYGVNEVNAYHIMVAKRKIGNSELPEDERRTARVEFFQVISSASGLGFDPYETALADEKLDLANSEKDDKKVVKCLSEVYAIMFDKPASVFKKPSQLLMDFTNELCGQLAFAMMRSPSFVIGLESRARAEIEEHMDFNKLHKSSLKRWEALKLAIES